MSLSESLSATTKFSAASRVALTAAANLLGKGAGVLAFVLFTPLLFNGLGERLFGVYQFALRLATFGGLTNLGASSYLKIRLNELAHAGAAEEKRTAIGQCLLQWLALSPLAAAWCALAVILAGGVTPLSGSLLIAVIVLVAVTPLTQLMSLSQVALLSEGLGYRGAIVSALFAFAGSLIAAVVAWRTGSLLGVAVATITTTALTGLYWLRLSSKLLPWWGVTFPSVKALIWSLRPSALAALASLCYLGLQQAEALTFVVATGAEGLSQLVISCALVYIIELMTRFTATASSPALSTAIVQGGWRSLSVVRREAIDYTTILYAVAASPILVLGPHVIGLWIPNAPQLSPYVVAAILLTSYFRVLAQFDGIILDQLKRFGHKVVFALLLVATPLFAATYLQPEIWLAGGYWLLPITMALYAITVARDLNRTVAIGGITAQTRWLIPSVAIALTLCLSRYAEGLGQDLLLSGGLSVATFIAIALHPSGRRILEKLVSRAKRLLQDIQRT